MVFNFILITLYIIQCIFFTNAQYVQTMPPRDSCVATTFTIQCSDGFVPVVRTALYGVAQITGSCTYSTGDCVADAMSIVTCLTDNTQCSFYPVKKKLPQCNDQFSSYVHLEYDCVPISMSDTSREYNVCQNGTEITTDHGIIRSPGYPTQFQTTTTECFRAIHVPSDKAIRLWLSDLFIGSTSLNCANDHLLVVDSVQTYRFCGFKRYVYPYLCSSTIIIQYLTKTKVSGYRGMRMYFDIVDRVTNDNCPNPNGTVTPVPETTLTTTRNPGISTTAPTYAILGLASPIESFQICQGATHTIQCPNNYGIVIHNNIFGVPQSNLCEPHDAAKHCVITTEPTFSCRQSCTYFYPGNQLIPTCNNRTAAYQYVEYQCIPTTGVIVSPNTQCPSTGSKVPIQIDRNGIVQSYGYPTLSKANCTYRLKTKPGYIMNIYTIDINLNSLTPDCTQNKLTLIEDGETDGLEFCREQSYSLLTSTCSNEIDLNYVVNDNNQPFTTGFQLYIESQTRPPNWDCGKDLPSTTTTTIRTTPFTTKTLPPLTNETSMFARDEVELDACFGGYTQYTCPTGYTLIIVGAFYGIKRLPSNPCKFTQGDCTQETLATITQCRTDQPNCYIQYTSRRRLAHCSDNYADYLHLTVQCVPSKPVKPGAIGLYDICETTNNIADFNGVVISPGFPSYRQTMNECKRTLIGIQDRVLRIWINEMVTGSGIGIQRSLSDESTEPDLVIRKQPDSDYFYEVEDIHPLIRDICPTDYLIINSPCTAYVYCGTRKLAMTPICAGTVDIQYKAASPPSVFYKGFKLYFEWIPKPVEIVCCGDPQPSTTTPAFQILDPWAQNLDISPQFSRHICLGSSTVIKCQREADYVIAITESNYRVSGTGSCGLPSASHCEQEASLGLTCTKSCYVEYFIPKPLVQCGMQNADYLNIDYLCIPTILPNSENPIDICSSTSTDTIALNQGMLISPKYPTLSGIQTCSKKIETLPNKIWEIYIVDLFMEGTNDMGNCDGASLTITDGSDIITLCGLQQPENILTSCSNIVNFRFISNHQAIGYRGFKVLFKTVDRPDNWACTSNNLTTTTKATTPRPQSTTTLVPPSLQIPAYGGTTNGSRQYCKFPFIYQGKQQNDCLRIDPPSSTTGETIKEPWCSLTSDFDKDGQWGFCHIGITESTMYVICRSQTQMLKCPPGYVINIIAAEYAAKPDGSSGPGSCFYDKNDCTQSDTTTVQAVCAGKTSCTAIHFAKTLSLCQNRQSAYLHLDYECVPNTIQDINTYEICNSGVQIQNHTRRGYLVSPNFPSTQSNLDCTFNLQSPRTNQDIYLYILDMDLNGPNAVGEACKKDRLVFTFGNMVQEVCGKSATNFLLNTCNSSVTVQLMRTSDARGRGVKLYFEFRHMPPDEICVPVISTPKPSSTLSPPPTTTATLPSEPIPSTIYFKTLCYPDISALFGTNNFRCPQFFVLVILRAFYGKGTRCDYTPGDCTDEAEIVYRTCSGKNACSVSFINLITLSDCNRATANYLFVEYQCLPVPEVVPVSSELCTGQIDHFGGVSGVLKSPSYPVYTQAQCANATLGSLDNSNLVMKMFLLDLDIGSADPNSGECVNDYLSLSYQCNNQVSTERYCGSRTTELLFSTCTPTDKIFASYYLLSQDAQNRRGFALLYHLLPMSVTPPTLPTTRTTTSVTTNVTPAGPGPISTAIQSPTSCAQQTLTIRCNQPDYVLVIHKVQLTAGTPGSCIYSPNDCFEDRLSSYNSCGGKTTCAIFPPLVSLKGCNNSRSTYVYAEYQCIPTRPKLNLDVCSSTNPFERVQGGAIISSLNYTSAYKQCNVTLQSNPLVGTQTHRAFKIYILTLNLPMRPTQREQGAQCSDSDPYVEIVDSELSTTRLCGNSHTRYLVETCSNAIDIKYSNVNFGSTQAKYKGFEIYFESVINEKCRPTPAPPIPTPPLVIDNKLVCIYNPGSEAVGLMCTTGHGLVFLQSYQFITQQTNQCDVSQFSCAFPSEQPQAQCAGQQSCSYVHTISSVSLINPCQNLAPDSTQFYYQCLPMKPSTEYSKVTFCFETEASTNMGFIETPNFPNTYLTGQRQCSLRIPLPSNTDGKQYSVYLYVIELSIRDSSIFNPFAPVECYDSIKYTDGNETISLCGKIDQPMLQYYTNKTELILTLNISQSTPPSELNNWQGARLFFIVGDQSLPSKPVLPVTISTTTEKQMTSTTTDKPPIDENPKKPNHTGLIVGMIILALVIAITIISVLVYRNRSKSRSGVIPIVRYGDDGAQVDDVTTNGASKKPTSISASSLKGSGISFTTPFANLKLNKKEGTENSTDA